MPKITHNSGLLSHKREKPAKWRARFGRGPILTSPFGMGHRWWNAPPGALRLTLWAECPWYWWTGTCVWRSPTHAPVLRYFCLPPRKHLVDRLADRAKGGDPASWLAHRNRARTCHTFSGLVPPGYYGLGRERRRYELPPLPVGGTGFEPVTSFSQ